MACMCCDDDVYEDVAEIERIHAMTPETADEYLEQAMAFLKHKQDIAALYSLQDAINVNHKHVPTLYQLAILHERVGMNDVAYGYINTAIMYHDPADKEMTAQLCFMKASTLMGLDRYDEAEDVLNNALALDTSWNDNIKIHLRIIEPGKRLAKLRAKKKSGETSG